MSMQTIEVLSLWRGRFSLRRTMYDIAGDICQEYQIDHDDLIGPSRKRLVAWARQDFVYRAYALGHLSYPQIGRFLNRDHSTCVYARRTHMRRAAASSEP